MQARFEWDPAKAASNLKKHKVSFETAVRALLDPFCMSDQDRVVRGEERWQTTGKVRNDLIVLVAHTVRETAIDGMDVELFRIISARRATPQERRRYEQESGPLHH